MTRLRISLAILLLLSGAATTGQAAQSLVVQETNIAPVLDGKVSGVEWGQAGSLMVHDAVADIDLELKAIYGQGHIYILARYPDAEPSTSHRSWVWNDRLAEYEPGPDREDAFVLKWAMGGAVEDLSLTATEPYRADVWFWKACRTNPAGFADDKMHILSYEPGHNGRELNDRDGNTKYLFRSGDEGRATYKTRLVIENEGAMIPRFTLSEPTGSRADVRAVGNWSAGWWTIEFSRLLRTGHDDDVQFDVDKTYRFGVSRYELAGRPADPDASQPLYGCGRISAIITLEFARQARETVW